MTFPTCDSIIIPQEENLGVVHPLRNETKHVHTSMTMRIAVNSFRCTCYIESLLLS